MIKSGAPPDKVGVLHRLLPIEFQGFTLKAELISKDYHSLVPGIISISLEMVFVPLTPNRNTEQFVLPSRTEFQRIPYFHRNGYDGIDLPVIDLCVIYACTLQVT